MDPRPSFWHPAEGLKLDQIHDDLIRLLTEHSNGWAAYVNNLDTPGIQEYFVYFGEGAGLDKVLPALKSLHPTYRLEFDVTTDENWVQYRKWLTWLESAQKR